MRQTDFLRLRIEFTRFPPDKGVSGRSVSVAPIQVSSDSLEVRCQRSVDAVTNSLYCRSLTQADGVSEIGLVSSLLSINPMTWSAGFKEIEQVAHLTKPNSRHILSKSQSMPRSISQLIMIVLPSPSRAILSRVSIDTPSILLITVIAGKYFLVPVGLSAYNASHSEPDYLPSRTSMNSSVVIYTCQTAAPRYPLSRPLTSSLIITSQLWTAQSQPLHMVWFSSLL